jgi:hypothetical protein
MSKDLIAAFEAGLPAKYAPAALSTEIDKTVREAFGGKIYGRFSKGKWTAGEDHEDITGLSAVVLLALTAVGKIAWKNAKGKKLAVPEKTPLVRLGEIIPETEGVTDNPNSQTQFSIPAFVIMDDEPVPVVFDGCSSGFLKAVNKLAKACSDAPEGHIPLVKLESDSYTHPVHGEVHVPVFELDKFVPEADLRGAL